MGVYISEINMPKGEGSKLVLQIFPNGEVYNEHGARLGITNWADAVQVQPHGRLIDADMLMSGVDDGDDVIFVWAIADAPTIIPADPEGEEMK